MKLEVNIEKKHFFILASILVLGFLITYTNAYNEGAPTVTGHSWNDIGDIPEGFLDGTDDGGSGTWEDLKANGMPSDFADDVDDNYITVAVTEDLTLKDNRRYIKGCPDPYEPKPLACSANAADGRSIPISFTSTACSFNAPDCSGSWCEGAHLEYLCRYKTDEDIDHQNTYIRE